MNKMFESAVLKLTAWYVGVLMLVSLAFSLPVFIITSDRLGRSASQQMQILRENQLGRGGVLYLDELNVQRETQLELDRQQLLNNIIIENLLILVIGSIASYLFARRTLRPIEEVHNAQSKFTANASHQLRTPLATMQAEIDVALRDKKLSTAAAREVLHSNLEEIGRLRVLSDQLLKLTRTGDADNEKTFDLTTVVKRFVTTNKKRYNLVLAGDTKRKACVVGDPVLIEEVLKILCENAHQYSEGKQVVVGYIVGRSSVKVSITDLGPGMSQAEQARVFDRFYRGKDSARTNPSGHGLGLALAQDIVSRHDGSLALKSKPGKGTTFTVCLSLGNSA